MSKNPNTSIRAYGSDDEIDEICECSYGSLNLLMMPEILSPAQIKCCSLDCFCVNPRKNALYETAV